MTVNKPKHAWMVRAGDNNELAPLLEERKAVAVGWDELPDLAGLLSFEEFKTCYAGDYALSYLRASRTVLVGVDAGLYRSRE
jgi:hypothetical protein